MHFRRSIAGGRTEERKREGSLENSQRTTLQIRGGEREREGTREAESADNSL